MTDLPKTFFQQAWGKYGYYEYFSYGVGIDKVCEVALTPFLSEENNALEIGSGGGTFTDKMNGKFKTLTAIDVIRMPDRFSEFDNFRYIELPDRNFSCDGIERESIDFCFSYNVFCHLSNDAIREYLKSVNEVLKEGGDFVFMLSNYRHTSKVTKDANKYSLGDFLPMGHFYQDFRTLPLVADFDRWEVVSDNLLPDHRDIVIHLKKRNNHEKV